MMSTKNIAHSKQYTVHMNTSEANVSLWISGRFKIKENTVSLQTG